jgi:hypothetical protein
MSNGHLDPLDRIAKLEAHLNQALLRIRDLEHYLYTIPEVAARRDLRHLKAKFQAQGMSSRQAQSAAWKELNRP